MLRMWKLVKQKAPHLRINLHSCGGIEPLLDDLVDAGLDTFNPVQINCKGMEPEFLKTKHGKKISFWGGGCDTSRILPHGTPEEIRRHVLDTMETFARESGFIFQQVHNIQADVPPENILAMFDAAKEFNKKFG